MKRYIIIAALLFGVPAHALDCRLIGDLAEDIMTKRQNGVPMSDQMEWAGNNQARQVFVVSAYQETRFTYEENQIEAVQDFRNTWEAKCYAAR